MPKSLAIVKPLPISALTVSAGTGGENLLTPNPKEVFWASAGAGIYSINIDMGANVTVDSFLLGYLAGDSPGAPTFTAVEVWTMNDMVGTGAVSRGWLSIGTTVEIDRHGFMQLAAPVTSRYFRFRATRGGTGGAPTAGVLAIGAAFQTLWGHEYGSGRMIEDTSEVERLFAGGFGINQGVIAGGYQWTFGDLTDAELASLYILVRQLGASRSVLVVEDPEATAGLNERIHWGLFDRLEPYERLVPGASRWAFRIKDWA